MSVVGEGIEEWEMDGGRGNSRARIVPAGLLCQSTEQSDRWDILTGGTIRTKEGKRESVPETSIKAPEIVEY